MKANGKRVSVTEARVAKRKTVTSSRALKKHVAPVPNVRSAVRSLVGGVNDREARDAKALVVTLRLVHELRRDTVIC